eukprot:CAMPEP_0172305974 /NCGR_PEP_ID=MMETSP1058-20130122/7162_1 /TAXON_ID=83371 /ORGANISM="Detonula confervacea, Strain CCMP 353" /LENGTH=636 /DNA_ID=CAMNT_0013017739 /DNA_START=51 /DNA_END=1961 /DNA_ORIENTATION=-
MLNKIMLWLPLLATCINVVSAESNLLRNLEGMPDDAVVCLTEEQCQQKFRRINWGGNFYPGDHPTKGCFSKNSHVYFGTGGTVEEMSSTDLAGIQERIWCDGETDAPTSKPSKRPTADTTQKPVTDSPTKQQTPKPVTDSPTKQPTQDEETPTEQPTPKPSELVITLPEGPTKAPAAREKDEDASRDDGSLPIDEDTENVPTFSPTWTPSQVALTPAEIDSDPEEVAIDIFQWSLSMPLLFDVAPTVSSTTGSPSKKPTVVTEDSLAIDPTEQPTTAPVTGSPIKKPTAKPVLDSPLTSVPLNFSTQKPTLKPVTDSLSSTSPVSTTTVSLSFAPTESSTRDDPSNDSLSSVPTVSPTEDSLSAATSTVIVIETTPPSTFFNSSSSMVVPPTVTITESSSTSPVVVSDSTATEQSPKKKCEKTRIQGKKKGEKGDRKKEKGAVDEDDCEEEDETQGKELGGIARDDEEGEEEEEDDEEQEEEGEGEEGEILENYLDANSLNTAEQVDPSSSTNSKLWVSVGVVFVVAAILMGLYAVKRRRKQQWSELQEDGAFPGTDSPPVSTVDYGAGGWGEGIECQRSDEEDHYPSEMSLPMVETFPTNNRSTAGSSADTSVAPSSFVTEANGHGDGCGALNCV